MSLILLDILRYLISGLFTFSNLNKFKGTIFVQSIIYIMLLIAFKLFVIDSPIITFISAILVFAVLIIADRLRNVKFSITYSLFISCLLEYTHFLSFKTVSLIRYFLGFAEVTRTQPVNLTVFRLSVFIIYTIFISLIYMFKIANVDSIKKLSNHKVFSIFLSVALFVITYLKYHIKYTESNKFHDVLSFVFVLFVVVFFVFLLFSKTFLNIIDSLNRKKVNRAIEESKLQKQKGCSELKFISEELNFQMNCFLDILQEIGMSIEDKKSKQIAYCAVLLNHEENPKKVNTSRTIYPCVADILDRQAKTIECNISNAIKNLWNSCDAEVIKKTNRNYKKPISSETGCPTPKEFLLHLIEKFRSRHIKS